MEIVAVREFDSSDRELVRGVRRIGSGRVRYRRLRRQSRRRWR